MRVQFIQRRSISRPVAQGKRARLRTAHPEAGISFLEVIIVVAIFGALAALAGPPLVRIFWENKVKIAKAQIKLLSNSVDLFHLDSGRYPTTSEGLRALIEKPGSAAKWNGPYLKDGLPNDPWGRPYNYRAPGQQGGAYDVFSLGADNQQGGTGENADVTSWSK